MGTEFTLKPARPEDAGRFAPWDDTRRIVRLVADEVDLTPEWEEHDALDASGIPVRVAIRAADCGAPCYCAGEFVTRPHDTPRDIAARILADPALRGAARECAAPYLRAMLTMSSPSDAYGADDGRGVILYALTNLRAYRGDTARECKAIMRAWAGAR